jgi:hypothetical protein
MHLKQIDTSINMADHFTKVLNRSLFHGCANFLVGHVPLMYTPVYHKIAAPYTDQSIKIECFVPDSFATPICANATRVYAPLPEDYVGIPWLIVVLWHG